MRQRQRFGTGAVLLGACGLACVAPPAWGQIVVRRPAVAVVAEEDARAGRESDLPIYVNDSREAQELAAEAERLVREDRRAAAAGILQRILDDHGNRLMGSGQNRYIDATLWTERTLAKDEALLEAYRVRYDAVAEHLLSTAGFGDESESAQARDPEILLEVRRRFGMTRPGLEAALLLAGLDLERGDAHSASGLLDSVSTHPDADDQAERLLSLKAAAAALRGQKADYEAALVDLRQRGLDEAVTFVRQLSDSIVIPKASAAEDRLADLGELPPMRQALWQQSFVSGAPSAQESQVFNGAVLRNQQVRIVNGRVIGNSNQIPSGMISSIPEVVDSLVLINDGMRMLAMDRWSGRELWALDWSNHEEEIEFDDDLNRNAWMRQAAMQVSPDVRGVAARGGRAFAVMGYSSPQYPNTPISRLASLAAVSTKTGKLLWKCSADELGAGLDTVSFKGTPVTDGQRVYVAAHKTQRSGFNDSYIFCVDAMTGELRWRLHLSSVASMMGSSGPEDGARMSLYGDRLYATDAMGTAAAVDARTGVVQWIRILAEGSAAERGRLVSQRNMTGPPVLTSAGLMVPMGTGSKAMRLVNPDDGLNVEGFDEQLENDAFNGVARLVQAGPDVLLIGRRIALADGQSLAVKWTHTDGPGDGAFTPAVSKDFAVVPDQRQVTVLSMSDGEVLQRVQAPSGHAAAREGELYLTNKTTVSGYMSWGHAYGQLIEQIEGNPTDPAAALALAHLGHRNSQEPGLLEGLAAAIEAARLAQSRGIATAEDDRSIVFDKMLDYAKQVDGLTATTRQELFDRLALLSENADEEVRYHLAVGDFLGSQKRGTEAVHHFQAVLLDPALSDQPVRSGGIVRRAALESRQRLEALVQTQGQAVYAEYDARAEQLLKKLAAEKDTDVDGWLELPDRFPTAAVAGQAYLAAAKLSAQSGDAGQAAYLYRRAFRESEHYPEVAAEAAGGLTTFYVDAGRPGAAVRWLKRVAMGMPDLQPIRDGEPIDRVTWIAELSLSPAAGPQRPRIEPPLGEVETVAGRLVVPHSKAGRVETDGLLLERDGQLVMLDAPDRAASWSTALKKEAQGSQVLLMDDELTMLFNPSAATVTALSSSSGKTLWEIDSLRRMLNPNGDAEEIQPAREEVRGHNHGEGIVIVDQGGLRRRGVEIEDVPDQAAAAPTGHLFIGVSEANLCVANQAGQMLAIDLRTGQVVWRRETAVSQALSLDVNDEQAVLLGISEPSEDARVSRIIVIDLYSGEQAFAPVRTQQPPLWAGLMPDGALITAMADAVTAHDATSGRLLWRTVTKDLSLIGRGSTGPSHLGIADDLGGMVLFDPTNGKVRGRVQISMGMTANGFSVETCDDILLGVAGEGIVGFNADGEVAWRDGLATPGGQIIAALPGQRSALVMVCESGPSAFTPATAKLKPQQWAMLDLTTGLVVDSADLTDKTDLNLEQVWVRNGYLAVSAGDQTAILSTGNRFD